MFHFGGGRVHACQQAETIDNQAYNRWQVCVSCGGGRVGEWCGGVVAAEGVGFEPTVRLHAHTLSKRAP